MAGAMRKVGEYLGLVEQADFDDEFDEEYDEPAPVSRQPAVVRPAPVASIEEHRRPASAPPPPLTSRASRPSRRAPTTTPARSASTTARVSRSS